MTRIAGMLHSAQHSLIAKMSGSSLRGSSLSEQNQWDFFRVLALGSCCFSLASILFLTISLPTLYVRVEEERAWIAAKSSKFKESSNRIWTNMQGIKPAEDERKARRSLVNGGGACEGCKQLTCPPGQMGLPGPPGEDSQYGQSGLPGKPGEDGFDIELEPEQDQPCSVCPSGPPGMRGNQGEPGMTGPAGVPGTTGESGQSGGEGLQGMAGPPGSAGPKGEIGLPGPPGDAVIAGVGVKGPKGPPGSMGAMGAMGMSGKSTIGQGPPGGQGVAGPQGQPGQSGAQGQPGGPGPPGEPGQPSMYCPSDCGVSHIKMPGFGGQIGMTAGKEEGPLYESGSRSLFGTVQRKIRQEERGQNFRRGTKVRRHPTGGYYWHS